AGEPVADAPAESDHLHHFQHAFAVAPGDAFAGGDVLTLRRLHHGREHLADFDGVVTPVVGTVDHVGDGLDVVVAAVGAERPRGLVLHRFHLHLVGAVGDFDFLLAGHGARVAG